MCPLPYLGIPSHISLPKLDSQPLAASLLPVRLLASVPAFLMTHCSPEAKPVWVSAFASLIWGLRGRLKAFRRLLLLPRSSSRPPQEDFHPSQTQLVNRTTGKPSPGCWGPTQHFMSVSSHGDDSVAACVSGVPVVSGFDPVVTGFSCALTSRSPESAVFVGPCGLCGSA